MLDKCNSVCAGPSQLTSLSQQRTECINGHWVATGMLEKQGRMELCSLTALPIAKPIIREANKGAITLVANSVEESRKNEAVVNYCNNCKVLTNVSSSETACLVYMYKVDSLAVSCKKKATIPAQTGFAVAEQYLKRSYRDNFDQGSFSDELNEKWCHFMLNATQERQVMSAYRLLELLSLCGNRDTFCRNINTQAVVNSNNIKCLKGRTE